MSDEMDMGTEIPAEVLAEKPSAMPTGNTGEMAAAFGASTPRDDTNLSLEAVYDVPVNISVVLGKTTMQVHQLLKLGRGAVVELDRKVGEPIDILVNNRLVARGEIVVVEDRIGVTMTEIMKAD
ncbi:MAG: flagellar motor switch protein FliN [Rickettsiales bacterium]|nr:flagellar motor switch protein FliN [Rickettsiales bacterium]